MPFDLAMLAGHGVSAQLAAKYAAGGWLERLGQGVYSFAGDTLDTHETVKFMQTRIPGLHVAGKSALSLQGVRHNLAARDRLVLWGDVRTVLPGWLLSRFPARYVHAQLFDLACWHGSALATSSLTTPPGCADGLQVSVPERAVLEMLYEAGAKQGLEEAQNIFAGLRGLRPDVLGALLACCTSVKAVRLFLAWSRETGVADADALLAEYQIPLGSGKRWISRMKDGTLLVLKP